MLAQISLGGKRVPGSVFSLIDLKDLRIHFVPANSPDIRQCCLACQQLALPRL